MNIYEAAHQNTKGLHYAGPSKHNGRIIIDAAEIRPGFYEIMAMTPAGREIRTETTTEQAEAARIYEQMFAALVKGPEEENELPAPLIGKYAKLRADLEAAREVGEKAAALSDDGGTCNFDAVSLFLPRWHVEKVKQAAQKAGCGCFIWNFYGVRRFVFTVTHVGQANKRTACAEAMEKELAAKGYTTTLYCQAD